MKTKSKLLLATVLLALTVVARGEEAMPAAAPAAPNAAAPAAPASLKAEAKVGTGVEKLEPTGVADSFDTSSEKVVGWSRIEGAQEPAEITHVWIYKGNEISTVPLQVKSASYRTYSRKTITGMPGSWTFQVKDSGGNVLAEKKFEVTASAPAATEAPANTEAAPATKTQ